MRVQVVIHIRQDHAFFIKTAGLDAVFLPITSNDKPNGEVDQIPNEFQVAVKFGRHGLVKVNQPISVSIKSIIESGRWGFQVPMNDRRKIIATWNKLMNYISK